MVLASYTFKQGRIQGETRAYTGRNKGVYRGIKGTVPPPPKNSEHITLFKSVTEE